MNTTVTLDAAWSTFEASNSRVSQGRKLMHKVQQEDVSTVGSGASVRGNISGQGSLMIEGTVEGDVSIAGDLNIAPGAQVNGTIQAGDIAIQGQVNGELMSSGVVHAAASSVVHGSITGSGFSMDEGATVTATINADFEMPPELL